MSMFRTEQLFNLTNHIDRGALWESFAPTALDQISHGYDSKYFTVRYKTLFSRVGHLLDWKALMHMTVLLDIQDES